ncbi:hypothetical protein [Pseudomonas grandcourensis]|uniref:hypothetical protein n=1 Tax=Pseudomonas grandcourensis TaxID=3136736 RepID=UPI0032634C9C
MAFTTTQLAARINSSRTDPQLWADSTPQNQGAIVAAVTTSFNNLQAWITQAGENKSAPFFFFHCDDADD